MRSDMIKVVIERPRSSGAYSFKDVRVRCNGLDLEQLDDLPKKQGYRRPHKENGEWKEFTDVLGPLHGFLISRIGKKWDDVFSEICEHINPGSTVQIHILSHVFQFVELHTLMGEDGHVYYLSSYRGLSRIGHGDLYVHPTTGVLCRMPERKRNNNRSYDNAVTRLRSVFGNSWSKLITEDGNRLHWHRDGIIAASKCHIRIGHEKELHKADGIWYWAVFSDVPPPFTMAWFEGGERREKIVRSGACDYWTGVAHTEGRYRSGRRQANRRDLRRYRLRND